MGSEQLLLSMQYAQKQMSHITKGMKKTIQGEERTDSYLLPTRSPWQGKARVGAASWTEMFSCARKERELHEQNTNSKSNTHKEREEMERAPCPWRQHKGQSQNELPRHAASACIMGLAPSWPWIRNCCSIWGEGEGRRFPMEGRRWWEERRGGGGGCGEGRWWRRRMWGRPRRGRGRGIARVGLCDLFFFLPSAVQSLTLFVCGNCEDVASARTCPWCTPDCFG